jgi:F-type H+-transporting ATPase subunit delta
MPRGDESFARPYARALLATLIEMKGEGELSSIDHQLERLADLTRGEAGSFLGSPAFDREEKSRVVDAFVSAHRVDPLLGRFFKLLVSQRESRLFPSIVAQFAELLREHRNEVMAQIRTAFPLDETTRMRLSEGLGKATGKRVLVKETVDPELIGGVVAEVGGTVFDASIRGYLERLREEFRS